MADPTLNTGTSVVDYLKSTGAASDFASRSALATKYGITGYTGSADQNTLLLTKVQGATKVAPPAGSTVTSPQSATDVKDMTGANSYINSQQDSDFADASTTGDPTTRTSVQNYNDLYDSITKSLTANLPEKPTTPNSAQQYSDLRSSYGVTDLESQLTDLNSQASDLQAASAARTQAEKDKPVAMNVISGRISEEENQDNIRLTAINNSIKTVTSQLQTKYNVIDNIMKYSGQDYANAVDSYNTQFTQNLNLMNTVKGIVDTQKSDAETAADDARANLQIIYNNFNSGTADPSTVSDTEKANITKLELQAGLPQGFYSSITSKNPKSDILSTTTREAGGQKYADVILRNSDGSLSTKSILLGASTSSDSTSQTQQLQDARAKLAPQIQAVKGADGYISPDDYIAFRDAWSQTGLSNEDFDKAFKSYANPESYQKLGLTF